MPVFNNWLAKIPKNLAGSMMPLIGSTLFGIFFFFFFNIYLFGYAGSQLQNAGSQLWHVGSFSCAMWDLVPRPGIEHGPPALGAQSVNHWTTREAPGILLKYKLLKRRNHFFLVLFGDFSTLWTPRYYVKPQLKPLS